MLLGQVFERFIQESPVSVMVRGLLEKALCPKKLDQLFKQNAKAQYTRELLFSTVVNLMSLVVCAWDGRHIQCSAEMVSTKVIRSSRSHDVQH